MNMMSLSLSDTLKSFIDEQVAEHAFETDGEYVRKLISQEYDRQQLRRLILEGMASPPAGEMNDAYFEDLRSRIKSRKVK